MSKLGIKKGKNLADEAKRMAVHMWKNVRFTGTASQKSDREATQYICDLIQNAKVRRVKDGSRAWSNNRRISCVTAALLLLSVQASAATVPRERAINAIIGESEGESYQGKLGIAAAIRNRGHLRGVYGERAPRVVKKLYSEQVRNDAIRAWEESETVDPTHGATGWGNDKDVKEFAKHKWWRKCVITARIGNHVFYKEKR